MAINKNKVLVNAQKYAEKGAYDKAINEYLKIVKEDPEDVRAWLKVGDLYAKKGARKEATSTYLKVAEYYASQGFYLKAVAVYKQILKLDPTVVQVNLRLAELYQQLGLLSDAQSQYEHVAGFFQRSGKVREALDVMQKLVDLDPDNVPSRIKLAELYSKAELRDEAVREFRVAADQLRDQGRIDDFIKVGERLLWHKADEVDLSRELSKIYLDRGDTKRALAKLQQCFQVDQRDIETLALLAMAFQSIGQVPKTVSVYKEMARILADQGNEARRKEVFESILALAPQDAEARQALFGEPGAQPPTDAGYDPYQGIDPPPTHEAPQQTFDLGYEDQGEQPYAQPAEYSVEPELYDGVEGIEEIEEIEEIDEIDEIDEIEDVIVVESAKTTEEEIRRLLTETDVFVKYGLYDKAIEHLERIFESQPHHIEAREKLKDLYIQLGDFDQAVLELLYLADVYAESDYETSHYYLQQIMQFFPDHPEALERMQRLSANIMPSVGFTTPPTERTAEPDDFFVTIDGELTEGYPVTDHRNGADPLYQPGGAVTTSEQPNPLNQSESTFETVAPEEELKPEAQATVSAALEEELEEVEFFIQQGLYDEAMNMLNELSQAYPGNPLVLEKLNEVSSQDGDDDFLDQSFDLGSQIPNELGDESEYSQPLTDEEGVKDVFEQFKQGIAQQVDAGDANTHYDLGVAYKEMGLVEDAVAEFEIARENPEREAISQTMIGDCYVQASQLTEAINAYKRGLYAERKTPDEELQLYYALGSTYLGLSDNDEALYYFQKVAKREPNFRDVQQQISTLEGS